LAKHDGCVAEIDTGRRSSAGHGPEPAIHDDLDGAGWRAIMGDEDEPVSSPGPD
jgi:hypothetical protein